MSSKALDPLSVPADDQQQVVPGPDALASQSAVAVVIDETQPDSNERGFASDDGWFRKTSEMAVKGKHVIKYYDDNKVISRKKSKVLNDVNINIPKGKM